MSRKALIFLADGMADRPLDVLQGKTPLAAADTPAMDALAAKGASGTFLTLPDGLPTSSDVANMSVLGFLPERNYPGRGPIEAAGRGIMLDKHDIAWRCNLVTVDQAGILTDYSAGHIADDHAAELIHFLQQRLGSDKVTFHSGVSYRNLLVLHGEEFSADVHYAKPDSSQGRPVADLRLQPLRKNDEKSLHTIAFLDDLSQQATKLLQQHPLNSENNMPANWIWPWSPGGQVDFTPFSQLYQGKRGAIISAVDVVKGIGKCAGMTVIDVPGATGFIDTNYAGKVTAALQAMNDFDFVYLHIEAIDECSHIGDLQLKMQAIEDFDRKIVAPVMQELNMDSVRVALLPDHPVPIELRQHTTEPVPVAVCGHSITADQVDCYSEAAAVHGTLGFMKQRELMELLFRR